jgi:hypothetical protein
LYILFRSCLRRAGFELPLIVLTLFVATGSSILSLALTGCLGWLDIFAEQHSLSGGYFLMQGEDPGGSLFLMVKGQSVSVAGPIHEIGWSQRYILFTDDNWPTRWNAIDVPTHRVFKINEGERIGDGRFKGIEIVSAKDTWTSTKRRH